MAIYGHTQTKDTIKHAKRNIIKAPPEAESWDKAEFGASSSSSGANSGASGTLPKGGGKGSKKDCRSWYPDPDDEDEADEEEGPRRRKRRADEKLRRGRIKRLRGRPFGNDE